MVAGAALRQHIILSGAGYAHVCAVLQQISEEDEEERAPAESPQKPKARRGIIIEDDDD